MRRVVQKCNTFENNFGIDIEFMKYLKRCCGLDFDQYFSFKYFLNTFCQRDHQNSQAVLGTTGINGLSNCRPLFLKRL